VDEISWSPVRRNEESLDSVICRFGVRRVFIEGKAGLAASVISLEDGDKILREFGSFRRGRRTDAAVGKRNPGQPE
jgi:hypothetical protein